eukprot:scaffold94995_cov42-Phaeocystis_antarctica.AAC.1
MTLQVSPGPNTSPNPSPSPSSNPSLNPSPNPSPNPNPNPSPNPNSNPTPNGAGGERRRDAPERGVRPGRQHHLRRDGRPGLRRRADGDCG